jgi:hypothetical protein
MRDVEKCRGASVGLSAGLTSETAELSEIKFGVGGLHQKLKANLSLAGLSRI